MPKAGGFYLLYQSRRIQHVGTSTESIGLWVWVLSILYIHIQ